MFRQAVGADEDDGPALAHVDAADLRHGLRRTDCAREHVLEWRRLRILLRQHPLLDEILGERLIARHLAQRAVLKEVAAAVAHLHHVQPGPDHDAERQRGRHPGLFGLGKRLGAHDIVCLDCRRTECRREFALAGAASRLITAERRRHVLRHRFRSEAARATPRSAPTHAVRNEKDCGEALAAPSEALGLGQARAVYHDLRMHGTEKEVVLVLRAHASRMREPEHVELVVARPLAGGSDGGSGEERGEFHDHPETPSIILRDWRLRRETRRPTWCAPAHRESAADPLGSMSNTPVAAAPGPDSANTSALRPVSAAYVAAMSPTSGSAASVARMATVPPLPPPVIFAPNSPRSTPAAATSVTSRSVPSLPSPHAP